MLEFDKCIRTRVEGNCPMDLESPQLRYFCESGESGESSSGKSSSGERSGGGGSGGGGGSNTWAPLAPQQQPIEQQRGMGRCSVSLASERVHERYMSWSGWRELTPCQLCHALSRPLTCCVTHWHVPSHALSCRHTRCHALSLSCPHTRCHALSCLHTRCHALSRAVSHALSLTCKLSWVHRYELVGLTEELSLTVAILERYVPPRVRTV